MKIELQIDESAIKQSAVDAWKMHFNEGQPGFKIIQREVRENFSKNIYKLVGKLVVDEIEIAGMEIVRNEIKIAVEREIKKLMKEKLKRIISDGAQKFVDDFANP